MVQNISEEKLRAVLGAELEGSRVIDEKINAAYGQIRNIAKKQAVREGMGKSIKISRVRAGIGAAAAVFALMVTFCVMNPALAKEIPILGGLFARLSDIFSFGQIPEEGTMILFREGAGSGASDERADVYQKTSGDITITLTEEYATNQAVFIGVNVKNAQEFPKMACPMDGTQSLSAETVESYSFRSDAVYACRQIEGKFTDAYTFEGILRIDYSEINKDDRKYQEAVKNAGADGMPALTVENYSQYVEEYAVPETFAMKLDITQIVGDLEDRIPVKGVESESVRSQEELERMTDEEWEAYMKSLPQECNQYPNKYEHWWQEGDWPFELQVAQKDSASRVIEVNEANASGIGIKSIELSAVEMTLNPTNTIEGKDTVAVALDADGNKIDNGSANAYELAIEGHDISKVYIYICDWDEYMDELKGYAVPECHFDKSFQEVLEERALFKTVVDTTR